MRSSSWTPRGKITKEFWRRKKAERQGLRGRYRGVVRPKPKSPRPLFSLAGVLSVIYPRVCLFRSAAKRKDIVIAQTAAIAIHDVMRDKHQKLWKSRLSLLFALSALNLSACRFNVSSDKIHAKQHGVRRSIHVFQFLVRLAQVI
jgi:hypothetical protein